MSVVEFFYPISSFQPGAGPIQQKYIALREANASAIYKALPLTYKEKRWQKELDYHIERPYKHDTKKDPKDPDKGEPSQGRD